MYDKKIDMKPIRLILLKSLFIFLVLLAVTHMFSGCGNDDDKSTSVNPADPNAVTKSIEVPNSTLQNGLLPTSSTNPDAPIIEDDNTDLMTVPGGELVIAVYPEAGDIKGFYLQIFGATQYFDIASTSPIIGGRIIGRIKKSGRKKVDLPYFIIRLPATIQPGSFFISYAAFDNANRVSNVVGRSIIVKKPGGNYSFLTSSVWSGAYTKQVFFLGGDNIELVGETYTQNLEMGIDCSGVPTNVSAELQNRTNYKYLTLPEAGNFTMEESSYSKTVDVANSNCTPAYIESTNIIVTKGSWVYESDTQKLIFILDASEQGSIIQEYLITESGAVLVLQDDLGNGDYAEIRYEPKN